MHRRTLVPLALIATCTASVAAAPPRAREDPETILRRLGAEAIRKIDTDTCFPATAEEYEALGKNAILKVVASSALSTELPLRSVYILHKGVRVPLQRVALLDKHSDATSAGTVQTSFYLLPIHYMKTDAQVLADFSGERRGFGFATYSAKEGLSRGAPAFARLNEYDMPSDADMAAVNRVLVREYPEDFPQ